MRQNRPDTFKPPTGPLRSYLVANSMSKPYLPKLLMDTAKAQAAFLAGLNLSKKEPQNRAKLFKKWLLPLDKACEKSYILRCGTGQ